MGMKTERKTIRLTEEMLELIDSQVGENFSERFENLIARCMWELPDKECRLAAIQTSIDQQLRRRDKLLDQIQRYERILQSAVYVMERLESENTSHSDNLTL